MEKNYLFIPALLDPVERGEWASNDAPGEPIGARVRAVCLDGLYCPGQVFPIELTRFAPDHGTATENVGTRAGKWRVTPEHRYRLSNCGSPFESHLSAGDKASRSTGAGQDSHTYYVTHTGPMPSWVSLPQFSYIKPLPGQQQGRDNGDGITVFRMTLWPTPDVVKWCITPDYPLRAGNGKKGQN